jgi:beta-alanine degradation protein BauB
MSDRLVEEGGGNFETADFAEELRAASGNHAIGTDLLLANERLRIFELRLEPGQRAPFHIHDKPYFWTVVDAGRGKQRFSDGTWTIHAYETGETSFREPSPEEPLVHDLENVGDTTLRFITVELTD